MNSSRRALLSDNFFNNKKVYYFLIHLSTYPLIQLSTYPLAQVLISFRKYIKEMHLNCEIKHLLILKILK